MGEHMLSRLSGIWYIWVAYLTLISEGEFGGNL